LEVRAPEYRTTLTRAAGHLAEAAQLLDALAQIDAAHAIQNGTLAVAVLSNLPAARGRNLLRYFLAKQGALMPDARRLDELLRQAVTAKADAKVCVTVGSHTVRRYAGTLYVEPQVARVPADFSRPWRNERQVKIPELDGVLEMRQRRGAGIDLEKLSVKAVTLRLRGGGEKLQPDAARPCRPVKDLMQMHGVPPWRRNRLPFLWSGERLVWVAGLGIDCAFRARAGSAGVVPRWIERAGGVELAYT
jgi:tRNA(Ile)-lysidine synthase